MTNGGTRAQIVLLRHSDGRCVGFLNCSFLCYLLQEVYTWGKHQYLPLKKMTCQVLRKELSRTMSGSTVKILFLRVLAV